MPTSPGSSPPSAVLRSCGSRRLRRLVEEGSCRVAIASRSSRPRCSP
jgi:hypothetical protein